MKRIVFFDIDGCFSTPAFKAKHGNASIDKRVWDNFVATIQALEAQIVMNSMWRRPALLTGQDPRSVLPDFARTAPFHHDAATPLVDDGGRGDWADAWLRRNAGPIEVAFLDDEAPFCLLPDNRSRFESFRSRAIMPDPEIGVTTSDLALLGELFRS